MWDQFLQWTETVNNYLWESQIDHPWAWPFMVYFGLALFVFLAIRVFPYGWKKFVHAIKVISGKYDHDDEPGEVTHRQALFTALSGTVGLGNISGVAIAVSSGGPGAVIWMILIGFAAMAVKFTECTLALKYRQINEDGSVSGGPMYYIQRLGIPGTFLVVMFATVMAISSLVGSNLFQVNEAARALNSGFDVPLWITGTLFGSMTAMVIFGGVKSIGKVASVIVPIMGLLYMGMCLTVLGMNFSDIPEAFTLMLNSALFGTEAVGAFKGAALGTVIAWALNRALFSSEAGMGSAATAHAAAKTNEPVREGFVACMEPFVDTVIVCTITGLTIVVSGAWQLEGTGVTLTQKALDSSGFGFGSYVLPIAVFLFAYSTVLGWCYYGQQAVDKLFTMFGSALTFCLPFLRERGLEATMGRWAVFVFNIIYVLFAGFGVMMELDPIVFLSNIISAALLLINGSVLVYYLKEVLADTREYVAKYINNDGDSDGTEDSSDVSNETPSDAAE